MERHYQVRHIKCDWPGCATLVVIKKLHPGPHLCRPHKFKRAAERARQRKEQADLARLDRVCAGQIEPLFLYAKE